MKTIRARSGPFAERPHFELEEIERMCLQELRDTGLSPEKPSAIRIDRFIEKRFGVSPRYEVLPEGVLGYTKFGMQGVDEIVVAVELDKEGTDVARRRLRTTLAHEGGHGLMHAHLFAFGAKPKSLFDEDDSGRPEILCRDVQGAGDLQGYGGRWWEYQANRAIGALLLPRPLVEQALKPFLREEGSFGKNTINPGHHEAAVRLLSEVFDVNPVVARYRLAEIFRAAAGGQLSL